MNNTNYFDIAETYNLSQLDTPTGYPTRRALPDIETDWNRTAATYNPSEYTAEIVKQMEGVWADNTVDPADIMSREVVAEFIQFDEDGLPLCPYGRTGVKGRGLLGRYGPNPTSTMIVMPEDKQFVLAVNRGSDIWGLPAGYKDAGETFEHAALRETKEEASLGLGHLAMKKIMPGLFIPTEQTTDNAWVETVPFYVEVNDIEAYPAVPDNEVEDAQWLPIGEAYDKLLPAHTYLLDQLGVQRPSNSSGGKL